MGVCLGLRFAMSQWDAFIDDCEKLSLPWVGSTVSPLRTPPEAEFRFFRFCWFSRPPHDTTGSADLRAGSHAR